MLQLDKIFLKHLQETWAKKIKVFFYEAGCSGTKIDVAVDDFDTNDLMCISPLQEGIKIYIEPKDEENLDGARITRVVKADHTGQEKIRYIFSNEKILERCGCGTSFSFEKKAPRIDLEKLQELRNNFKKWK